MENLPAAVVIPEVEMAEKTARRRFNAEYKRTVLKKADICRLGEIVALLRRKGLYSSHLSVWQAGTEEMRAEARAARPASLARLSC
jgi:hypothetical protein